MAKPEPTERHTLKHSNADVVVDIFKGDDYIEIKLGDTSLSFTVHKGEVVAYVFNVFEKRIISMFPVFESVKVIKSVEDLRRK